MQQRSAALSLLALIVVASGCANGGGNVSSNQGAVEVTQLDVTPESIRTGSTVRVEMGLTNAGVLPADLIVDRDENLNGDAILTDYCPDIFNVESFDSYSSSEQETQDSYRLKRGEEVRLNWELQQSGDVSVNGARCPMKFKVPFNYTVEAYRQVQILQNDEVGSAELNSASSDGPLKLLIETIGTSSEKDAPYFIEGDDIGVLVQLINEEPDEEAYTGALRVEPPEISTPSSSDSFTLDSCDYPDEERSEMILYEGESQVIRCDAEYNLEAPSITGEIRAATNYTFIKDIKSRQVEVEYGGR
jgi:hypothetical protein